MTSPFLRTLELEFNSTQLGPVTRANERSNPTQTELAIQMIFEASRVVLDLTQQRVLFLGGVVDSTVSISSRFSSKRTQELVNAFNNVLR